MFEKENFIGKAFVNVLCMLEPDVEIALGGENSNGYFYFGTIEKAAEEVMKLRNDILTNVEKALETENSRSIIETLMRKKEALEDFDLLNAEVIDIYNKKQDADVGIILSNFIPQCYWFRDEFDKQMCFSGQKNTIERVYELFPDLIGEYDPIL